MNESQDTTMAEHAEAWWSEQGKEIPPTNTPEWKSMYEEWIEFAFSEPPR